jgi:glycerol-3-phosphate acyltransferase PlsX
MGSFYAEDALKIGKPRVGLLNNGSERTKGSQLQLDSYELLEKAAQDGFLNFIGNVEANGAMKGACDVLVCDGFTGNILLKSIEGTARFIMSELKGVYTKNWSTKLSALLVKKHIRGLRSKLNPDTIGGTALLGISKPVIKAHGSSNSVAICSAILQAARTADMNIAARLQENMSRMRLDEGEQGD